MIIRLCERHDAVQVCDIYNYYVDNTVITFEETSVSCGLMVDRVRNYMTRYPWLVSESEEGIVGFAYATPWKERSAYRNTAEVTVYIRCGAFGRGYGKALYRALLLELEQRSCHVVLGCIALPNKASVGLHEAFGFTKVAHFSQVGYKFGQWLDVGYWQLTMGSREG